MSRALRTMGLLRFYLAAAVIAWHAGGLGGFLPLPGHTAVQVFYIISGFYMALVLNTKYLGPGSYRLFLSNRLLRIFPAYWAVLLLTLAFSVVGSWYLGHSRLSPYQNEPLKPLSWVYLLVANVSVLGQDATLFLDLAPDGSLGWPSNFLARSGTPLHMFMFVPQGWSLSLELMFYAVAPFLVRRRLRAVLAVIGASLALRAFTYGVLGYSNDPWNYRFFPTELALFLSGTISYRLYERLRARPPRARVLMAVGLAYGAVTLGYDYVFRALPGEAHEFLLWGYFALTVAAIPFLFLATAKSRLDRYIGELSFPIYISHILVLMFLGNLLPHRPGAFHPWLGVSTLAVSVALSVAMIKYFLDPIDRYRHHLSRADVTAKAPVHSGAPALAH